VPGASVTFDQEMQSRARALGAREIFVLIAIKAYSRKTTLPPEPEMLGALSERATRIQ